MKKKPTRSRKPKSQPEPPVEEGGYTTTTSWVYEDLEPTPQACCAERDVVTNEKLYQLHLRHEQDRDEAYLKIERDRVLLQMQMQTVDANAQLLRLLERMQDEREKDANRRALRDF